MTAFDSTLGICFFVQEFKVSLTFYHFKFFLITLVAVLRDVMELIE